ncbi:MAG: division/cell wall cluster transcriptional repressor MraZ [Pseudomonadota bacterium]
MFRGWFEHLLDTKGRAAIPSTFRDNLAQAGDERLVITTALSGDHLVAYPLSKWLAFEERVRSQLPQFDANVERFRRLYIGGAMECGFDKLGRLVIPANLREAADLTKEIVFVGDIEKFAIWSKERWSETQRVDQSQRDSMQDTLANLGL